MKYIDADKIRAEIRRLYSEDSDRHIVRTSLEALSNLMDFLDTLEEPVSEDLEEELERRYEQAKWGYVDGFGETVMDKEQFTRIARHFAEWGAGHTPLPEDTVIFQKGVEEGKRLMMEGAVEGEIQMRYSGCLCAKTIRAINEDKFKFGDKVRIIIVKEEEQ